MATLLCPTADQLAAFQAGRLSEVELDQIAAHLDTCASCQTALETGSTIGDALMRELKAAREHDAFTEETGCQKVLAKIEALANGAATRTHDDTADNVGNAPGAALPLMTLGKYQLFEQIGQGGMGEVYKAMHTILKKTVAVKVLPPHRLKNADAIARFRREREAAGRLDHPNIVRAFDADEANGQHFLVMEWLAGQDLTAYVREHGPLPVAQACDFIRQAALGLDFAHSQGLVHRDVKPSNLMLTTADGQPVIKVLDLGLALLHADVPAESELTSAGQVMGTYDFIAPEQAMESHTVDARADMYSLGCTFYYLLTANVPFQGKSDAKKLLAHQLEEPTPLTKYRTEIPSEVVAMVAKLMAKDPAQRYATMRELADALRTSATTPPLPSPPGRGAGGEGVTLNAPASNSTASMPSSPLAGDEPPARRKKRPLLIAASLLLGLVAVIALVVGIIRITTPEGDFVIDTDDNKVKFSVSKGVVTLHDEETKRTYEVKAVRKASGEYELDVRDVGANLSFKTAKLTIHRGKTLALEGWFERNQIALAKGTQVDDAWIKTVQSMTAEKQVEAVAEKLKDLNPGFDGKIQKYAIDKYGIVTNIEFFTDKVKNISPVRALTRLTRLKCNGSDEGKGQLVDLSPVSSMRLSVVDCERTNVADLSPLKGMDLYALHCNGTQVSDLLPLKGMNLKGLNISSTKVTDLSSLKGMNLRDLRFENAKISDLTPLSGMDLDVLSIERSLVSDLSPLKGVKVSILNLDLTGVSDLSPLKGMKLTALGIKGTRVADLTVLKEMPLKELKWDFKRDSGSEILRSMKTLETINGKPAAEFWKEVDEQQPTPQAYTSPEHTDGITHLALSRDGTKALTYTSDKLLWFWELDAPSGKFKFSWKQKVDLLLSMALTPNGSQALFAAGASSNLSEIDTQTGKITNRKRGMSFEGRVVAFSADGRRYLFGENTGQSGTFSMCAWPGGEFLRKFEGHAKPIQQLCISSDGERILSAGEDQTVRLWDSTNGDELKKLSSINKNAVVALSPDGKQALISQDNDVRLVDLKTEKVVQDLKGHKDQVTAVAFGPDGSWAVSASRDKTLRVWDLATGKPLAKLEGHSDDVTCLAVMAAGRRIVSGSRDKTLRIWNWDPVGEKPPPTTAKVGELRRYLGHSAGVTHVEFAPDAKSFLSVSHGEIWLWDVDGTTERVRFPNTQGNLLSAGFSKDGQRVVGPAQVGAIAVWDTTAKSGVLAQLKVPSWAEWVALAPDRPYVFYTNPTGGHVYDLEKKAELPMRFLGTWASLSKDGRRLLSADGKTLYLWDADTCKEISNVELPGSIFRVALAHDGRHALAIRGNNVHQWDMIDKKEGKRLDTPTTVLSVAISPDGKRALTGGFDKKIRLWDLSTGTELHSFDNHTGAVSAVAFSPDGKQAISGSGDKTIRLWQLPADKTEPKIETPVVVDDKGNVVLDIVTKLGVKLRVEVLDIRVASSGPGVRLSEILMNRTDTTQYRKTGVGRTGLGRVCLDQGTGVFVFIPIRQIKKIDAEDKQHSVTLADGSVQKGKLLTTVYAEENKPYQLTDAESIVVLKPQPMVADKSKPITTLLTPTGTPAPFRLSRYQIQAGRLGFGTRVKMDVQGDKLEPDLADFDKTVVSGTDPKWRIRLTTPKGKETEGNLDIYGFSGANRWWLIGQTPLDWLVVLSSSNGSKGFTIEKAQAEPVLPKGHGDVGEIRTFLGHGGSVHSVAFAPDGKSFLSGGPGEILHWDLVSSKPKQFLFDEAKPLKTFGHSQLVTRIAFSRNGSHAVTGGVEQPVRIWDVAKGKPVKYVDLPKAPSHFVAWSPDDKYLLVAPSGSFVRLFAYPSLEESNDRFGGAEGHFSKDADKLLTLEGNTLQLYYLNPMKRTFVNVRDIHRCAVTPDGRFAVCGGLDSLVYVWDMVERKPIHKMTGHKGTIQALAVSPDGKRALSGAGDSTMRLWDLTTGKELRTFEGHGAPVVAVTFSPDGRLALSAGGPDKSVRLWQLPE